jgi:predicted nucleic acid-binding Zn ribbon protein
MPLYEYKCPKCGKVEERIDYPWDGILPLPPVCVHHTVGTDGETHYPMVRVPSAPAVHFKGEGWTKKGE